MANDAVTIDALVEGMRLQTMPAVAARLVDVTSEEQPDAGDVARVVGLDHALTAMVLRAANAGPSSECCSLPEAVDRLGTSAVTAVALGSMLAEGIAAGEASFNERTFRRWSIHVAVAARSIARMSGVWDADEAYAAGLLQDVGVLQMVQGIGRDYVDMLAAATSDHHCLHTQERESWGIDHAQVAAAATSNWGFPEHVTTAIAHHHGADDNSSMQAKVLDLASCLAAALLSGGSDSAMRSFRHRADDWLAIGAADTETLVHDVKAQADTLLAQVRISGGKPVDIERLLLRAQQQWVRHQVRLGHHARELERRNRDLVERADSDTLTGAGTRGLLARELPMQLRRCATRSTPLAVVFIDVDGLKPVNDLLGHTVGDDVLRRVAGAITAAAGEDATVCRYGGDEFVVLLPECDITEASAIADRMRIDASIEGRRCSDVHCSVTLSIGVASLAGEAIDPGTGELLMNAADEAMYVAKRRGGDAVELGVVQLPSQRAA